LDSTRAEPTEIAALQEECRRFTEALALAEQERQHLLYEIHDGVVQDVTAACLLLESVARHVSFSAPDASENFTSGLRLLRDSIVEARRLLRGTTVLTLQGESLAAALERLVAKARSDLQMPITLETNCQRLEAPPSTQHLLLRIVQESLANAWKHARSSEVVVQLMQREDGLELTIADNGVGFDPALVPAGHFGLESIRARAAALNADLIFDTAPSHGTRIVVRLKQSGEREA
jgi:signal transduction histidine kinase